MKNQLKLFENKEIRTAWDSEKEEWYFSVVDVVAVLTDSSDPKQYIKKMRARVLELSSNWGTICTPQMKPQNPSVNLMVNRNCRVILSATTKWVALLFLTSKNRAFFILNSV